MNNLKIEHYYFDFSGQCYKFSVSFSESGAHSYFGDNFVYENGMLVSYTEANNWQKNNGIPIKVVCKYNEEKQKIYKIEIRNDTDTTFYSYMYNQSGQLTDNVQESNNNEVVYSDVVPWSNKKTNKIHIRYSNFDKHGNWTKSYFITEKGKALRSERKIEYYIK